MARLLPKTLQKHWNDPRSLIQVILGPRQVGKTTAITELIEPGHSVYASADTPIPPTPDLIVENWKKARVLMSTRPVLVLDEIQKIPRWSETIKMLWDEDQKNKKKMAVWILGSSAILLEKGLSESLTGRFEIIFFPHWIYAECRKYFNATIEEYIRFGGYPKVYSLKDDAERCEDYIQNSIIDTTLGRDILNLHAVNKPALLRQLFWYISKLPARIVSFEKILDHLQGNGNSATLVHYAELLSLAFILIPLSKFSPNAHRTKKSQPKWIVPNPALVDRALRATPRDGFVFENLVGSQLANLTFGSRRYQISYFRERDKEIDFILTEDNIPRLAIEVKSGRPKRIFTQRELEDFGIPCPLVYITWENIHTFLEHESIESILSCPF